MRFNQATNSKRKASPPRGATFHFLFATGVFATSALTPFSFPSARFDPPRPEHTL
jgi:hypothetical protein